MKLSPHIHLFPHLPSSSCSVLKNFMAASLPPFITTWIKKYMKKKLNCHFQSWANKSASLCFCAFTLLLILICRFRKTNLSLDRHCYSCFRNPPLVATWKGWTRICNEMDGVLSCVFFTAATFMTSSFFPSWIWFRLFYISCSISSNVQDDAKTYFSCFASSASSGTARMFMKPYKNITCEGEKDSLNWTTLRKMTNTLLAPHLKAEVAQSNAVSPAPSTGIIKVGKIRNRSTKHWKYKSWKDQKSEHQSWLKL